VAVQCPLALESFDLRILLDQSGVSLR
jgi:hypothetical protein